ncbi:MAG: hypothetical protein ACE5IW_05510 [bacterium]
MEFVSRPSDWIIFQIYEDTIRASEGVDQISFFLGFWFIRKAMWANESQIKNNASSLKKFYQFMLERGCINQEAFDNLCQTIKEDMPEWLGTMRRFDNPSLGPEDVWDI